MRAFLKELNREMEVPSDLNIINVPLISREIGFCHMVFVRTGLKDDSGAEIFSSEISEQ